MSGSGPEAALADAVRRACIAAALDGYHDASVRGLCAEGAWEAAIGAMQSLDVAALVEAHRNAAHAPPEP